MLQEPIVKKADLDLELLLLEEEILEEENRLIPIRADLEEAEYALTRKRNRLDEVVAARRVINNFLEGRDE